ncbi:hypothetical protein [Streptomyces parvus]|uniref:hypothetical protein n=1 Tax=Streptomyces parvus TaxID=66428 RepID=UPI003557092B
MQASDTVGCSSWSPPASRTWSAASSPVIRRTSSPTSACSAPAPFRPGPVRGGMPALYIAARHGAAPTYPHPDLEPALSDTYGVTIWHFTDHRNSRIACELQRCVA